MLTNFFLAAFLSIIIAIISCLIEYGFHESDYDRDKRPEKRLKVIAVIMFIIPTIMICAAMTFTDYASKIPEIADLRTDAKYSLNNILILANSMNEKVIVKIDNDKLIVDVANMSQSSKTSDVYISYVNNVNSYNTKLSALRAKGERTWVNILYYGFYPPISDELKFIQIKM